MAFTHQHRFLKKYGMPYYVRLTLPLISELTGIALDELVQVAAPFQKEKDKIVAVLKYVADK
jgi:hypothetical protein